MISLAQMFASAETMRFDPEYFQKIHLADEDHVVANSSLFKTFQDLDLRIDASAFYPSIESYYDTGDLPFLRVADVDSVIDFESCTHIPAELCRLYPTLSKVKTGDIVFTKGGSVARIGLISQDAAVSRDLIFLNSSALPESDYTFLYLYFQTAFFNRMLLRSSSQTAQPHLTVTLVRHLPVFSGTRVLMERCVELVKQSTQLRSASIQQHAQAAQYLLRAIGLENWQPPEPLTYTRIASEVLVAERLDSDYFAPRVAELLNKLSEPGLTIGAVAPARHERFSPGKEGDFNYIEIGSVRADGTTAAERLPQSEAPSRASQLVRAGDVLTSSVRPIRRLSALVTPEQDGFVCSSGFVVLQPGTVPAEVLLTYLRLPVVCELMDLHTSASLYPAISEADLLSLPYHPIAKEAEAAIVQAVQSAHAARRQAHALLEAAKRAVEIAIEKSEAEALTYLQKYEV